MASVPSEAELTEALTVALRKVVPQLFARHSETFYYFVLSTTGEAHPPAISAWSYEALDRAVAGAADPEDARWGLKWSYGDSPYFCFGEQELEPVAELFGRRPDMDSNILGHDGYGAEYDLRLRAMEAALAAVDREGLFGQGDARLRIMINVEVVSPDFTNTERARRLNPPAAIERWLAEAAETE